MTVPSCSESNDAVSYANILKEQLSVISPK